MTVLNILRHFKCFYNVLSHCLWLKYCHGCLIWIANGQNLHFVQKYLRFILLRGDQNICGWETWKIDTLVQQFYGFHMQFLTTTFLFAIILIAREGSISENSHSFSNISLTECRKALSERQFGKQTLCLELTLVMRYCLWFIGIKKKWVGGFLPL